MKRLTTLGLAILASITLLNLAAPKRAAADSGYVSMQFCDWVGVVIGPGAPADCTKTAQLHLNDVNPWARMWQSDPRWPLLQEDGLYGPQTHRAIVTYQYLKGLPVSGVVDRPTWQAMLYECIMAGDSGHFSPACW